MTQLLLVFGGNFWRSFFFLKKKYSVCFFSLIIFPFAGDYYFLFLYFCWRFFVSE